MSMSALMSALRGAGRQHLTASTVAARQPVTGSHVFRIHGYTQFRKTAPSGTAVTSTAFHVGGHDWQIECYPNGQSEYSYGSYASLFLTSIRGSAKAGFDLSVVDGAGRTSCTRNSKMGLFESRSSSRGWEEFAKNDELELVDDCLTVVCDITVGDVVPLFAEEVVATTAPAPTFDLHLRGPFAEAMWSKETADVTVRAGGERFAAHRWVLEARSPVFKADLEKTSGELRVDGVDAETFQALLYFIYTDALPPSDSNQQLEAALAERLLVAADRYGLKLACEEKLCTRVHRGSVAAMLELSERHGCALLKEACIRFLSRPGNRLRAFMARRPMGWCR